MDELRENILEVVLVIRKTMFLYYYALGNSFPLIILYWHSQPLTKSSPGHTIMKKKGETDGNVYKRKVKLVAYHLVK